MLRAYVKFICLYMSFMNVVEILRFVLRIVILTEKQWQVRWVAELNLFETLPPHDSLSTASQPLALLLLLVLLLQRILLVRTLINQSEGRRRTCSRWLSSYLTGESATTWLRLTGMKFLTKSLKSISTRWCCSFNLERLFHFTMNCIVESHFYFMYVFAGWKTWKSMGGCF